MHANPKEIVRLIQAGRTAKQVAEELGVSIRTVRRWKKRAVSPHTLKLSRHQAKRRSTRPRSAPRLEALSRAQKEKIKELRIESGWGAERLGVVLGLEVNPSTIHRFLLKEGLAKSHQYRRPWHQDTTHRGLHNVFEPGTIQMDVKYATPQISGLVHTTYLYAAIDPWSRFKVGRVYPGLDSYTASEALEYFLHALPFRVSFVQTDNGLEFQSAFQKTLGLFNLPHHFIHKASPNENAVVERAFKTDEDEFFSLRLPRSGRPKDLPELNEKYQDWMHIYNFERPHKSLDFRTPSQVLSAWQG